MESEIRMGLDMVFSPILDGSLLMVWRNERIAGTVPAIFCATDTRVGIAKKLVSVTKRTPRATGRLVSVAETMVSATERIRAVKKRIFWDPVRIGSDVQRTLVALESIVSIARRILDDVMRMLCIATRFSFSQ